jgi:hypothetical protein
MGNTTLSIRPKRRKGAFYIMRSAVFIVSASIAAGSIGLVPTITTAATVDGSTTAPSALLTNSQATNVPMAAITSARIETRIADMVGDALTPNDMTKLVSQFDQASRSHIKASATHSEGYGKELDSRIQSINTAWKHTYGSDFVIGKAHGLFSSSFATMHYQNAGANTSLAASATINSAHGLAQIRVPLVEESGNHLKIDAPGTLTAGKLRANLLSELTQVNDRSAHWPSNESDGYRMVAHHVLLAVMDKPTPAAHENLAAPKTEIAPAAKPQAAAPQNSPNSNSVAATPSGHWWQFWK